MKFPLPFLVVLFSGIFSSVLAQRSPNEFLPHKLGEQFTPHHLLNAYFEQLAQSVTATMRLEKYGKTNEGRPLQIAIFASAENMMRLEQIRLNNLRMAGMA
ncbi:MAG: zinc carboxypeptidase, partial [Saprospiraceae bacterium]|nr:zinc carboxypeptidase [Saprospiraceae bacterium]